MKNVLVLMATYNGEQYLQQQLESLFEQENVQLSILVRDDGSNDRTCAILQEYQEAGKLTWYTGKHLNAQYSFFDLMKKAASAEADYIAFCDQDDVWDPDKLKLAVDSILPYGQEIPALYYCGQRLVDRELNFLADHVLNKKRSLQTRFVLSDFAGCTGVFNKKLLLEAVAFEPRYMLMHDTWILKICLCLGGMVVVDPQPHMCYRQHPGNSVGLEKNISAYIKQVYQYLNVYNVEAQMHQLLQGYGDRMLPQYKEIAQWICGYRSNNVYRKKLLAFKEINFCSMGLNITYWLKVMLNKL